MTTALIRRPQAADDASSPDMTPMIDVVFQLLIFFMLTMQFREVEGTLLSQLPRSHGPSDPAVSPDLKEVRVLLRSAGPRCAVAVDGHALGDVTSTEAVPAARAANKAVYRAAGEKARELLTAVGGRRVVVDAAPEVPYEHVLGVVDGLKQSGLDSIEFAANPRFQR